MNENNTKRDELIKSALLDKLGHSIEIYTADDILTVADISDDEMQEFMSKIQSEIEQLSKKASVKKTM